MEEKLTSRVIKTHILELEDKFMDLSEISSNYLNVPTIWKI